MTTNSERLIAHTSDTRTHEYQRFERYALTAASMGNEAIALDLYQKADAIRTGVSNHGC
jgi:hypothetical protein